MLLQIPQGVAVVVHRTLRKGGSLGSPGGDQQRRLSVSR